MTDYEKAMLKLKLLELAQRQTILDLLAHDSTGDNAVSLAAEGGVALNAAVASTRKLL